MRLGVLLAGSAARTVTPGPQPEDSARRFSGSDHGLDVEIESTPIGEFPHQLASLRYFTRPQRKSNLKFIKIVSPPKTALSCSVRRLQSHGVLRRRPALRDSKPPVGEVHINLEVRSVEPETLRRMRGKR